MPKVSEVFRSTLGFLAVLGCTAKSPVDGEVRSEGVHQASDDLEAEIRQAVLTPTDPGLLPPIEVCGDLRARDIVKLHCPPDTVDTDLERIDELAGLIVLGLGSTKITDVGLQEIRGINLAWLDLGKTRVSDEGLATLVGMPRLSHLWLDETEVTDAGLRHLAKFGGLQRLHLRGLDVTDAGMAHLAGHTKLVELDLEGTRVSDAGLESLAGLVRLEKLDLQGTQVTGPGMRHLQALDSLLAIDLRDTAGTDANLEHFIDFYDLDELRLEGTRVTRKGALRLAPSLPFCRIYYGSGEPNGKQQGVVVHLPEQGYSNMESYELEVIEFSDEYDDVAIFPRSG